jgi:hypothetical protein
MSKIKRLRNNYRFRAVAEQDAKHDTGLHNRHGGGRLPPSQLGWGQHKADKARVTLPAIDWSKSCQP